VTNIAHRLSLNQMSYRVSRSAAQPMSIVRLAFEVRAIVSVGALKANAQTARGAAAVIVRGLVQRTGKFVNLNAERLEPPRSQPKPSPATSADAATDHRRGEADLSSVARV
jgi:hypothetical protein